MPDPVDIYARLRFQQGTVAADARTAMETARKEFAQGINVPLRFQQQGGGTGGGGAGAVNTAAVTQAATAAAKAATPATAAVITQAATTAATKAATTAARGTGGGAAATAANAVGGIAPVANDATQSLAQMVRGIRTVTRVAAIAEGVAAVAELGIHGGRLFQARAEGKNLTAAAEVSAMQDIVKAVPFVGAIADKLGNTVYELISATKNFANVGKPGTGKFESDQEYAQRLDREQKFQDKIGQMRAQRARAFLPGPQAAVAAAEETRTEFTSSKEAQLLREQNPDLYRRVYEEIGRTINIVKKKAAIEDEHDTFQHQQTLTRINDQAEIARMNASGNRLGAERKQVGERYDYEIAAAEQAAKELREVNRDKEAEEQDQRAAALRGLKSAELEEANARNRMIGFASGTALWQRMMEAAARYTEIVKGAGDATVAAASKAQGAAKATAAQPITAGPSDVTVTPRPDIGPGWSHVDPNAFASGPKNIEKILQAQGIEIPQDWNDRSGLLMAARNYDKLREQATDPKLKTKYANAAATLRHLAQAREAARLGHQVGATPGGMPRGTEEFETGFTEEAQQAAEQGGTPEFLGAQQQRALEARMRLNLQKKKRPTVALDQGGDFTASAGTAAAPNAGDFTPTLASGGVRDIALADGSFDKFKRAMKEAMRESGAQFEVIK